MLGRMWRHEHAQVGCAQRARRLHKLPLLDRHHLRPHQPRVAHPAGDRKRQNQVEQARPEERHKRDRKQNAGQRQECIGHIHVDHGVGPSAVKAGQRARDQPDARARARPPRPQPSARSARRRACARGCRGPARRCRTSGRVPAPAAGRRDRAARGPAAQATAQRPRTTTKPASSRMPAPPAAAAECSATGATVAELVERCSSALQSFHKVPEADGGYCFQDASRCI